MLHNDDQLVSRLAKNWCKCLFCIHVPDCNVVMYVCVGMSGPGLGQSRYEIFLKFPEWKVLTIKKSKYRVEDIFQLLPSIIGAILNGRKEAILHILILN